MHLYCIVGAVGLAVMAMMSALALLNLLKWHAKYRIRLGVPDCQIVPYFGKDGEGTADTFQEVRLACERVQAWGENSAYVVESFADYAGTLSIFE